MQSECFALINVPGHHGGEEVAAAFHTKTNTGDFNVGAGAFTGL